MTEHNLFWGFYSEELREIVRDRKAWHAAIHGVAKSQTRLSNWTELSQGYGLPSGHVCLWELGHKEGRTSKHWCLQTVVLEKTPESPLDKKETQQVNLKGNQPWILVGRADAEAEAPVFWSFDLNSQLNGKVPDAGKDWGQKEKRASEDETAGRHHWRNERELEQTLGDGEGQGSLVCCSPWGHRVGHDWATERQQNT